MNRNHPFCETCFLYKEAYPARQVSETDLQGSPIFPGNAQETGCETDGWDSGNSEWKGDRVLELVLETDGWGSLHGLWKQSEKLDILEMEVLETMCEMKMGFWKQCVKWTDRVLDIIFGIGVPKYFSFSKKNSHKAVVWTFH